MKGFDFRFNTVVGLLFGVAILAILFGLFKRTGLRADLRPPPRDVSKLFAFRFTLSFAFLGLSVAWLTTQPAYSWPIWGLLTYFGASGVICYLVFGVRNGRWIYRIQSMSISGFLSGYLHGLLMAVGAGAVGAALDRGDRAIWPICGLGLAAVAACSWAMVRWADPQGG